MAPFFDGFYRKESGHEGRPVLKKEGQPCIFLYHFEAKSAWRLGGRHRPNEDLCNSHIAAPDGLLPTGARTWLSHPSQDKPAPSAEHEECVFSVTLLVRRTPPFPCVSADSRIR